MKKKKALKRKSRRKVYREMGKAGIPAKKKSNEERVILEPPISVIFIDNTKNGTLPKMLQETEKRLGGMTSFRVRVAESAGMARPYCSRVPILGDLEIVVAKIASCAANKMNNNRIVENVTSSTRTDARYV